MACTLIVNKAKATQRDRHSLRGAPGFWAVVYDLSNRLELFWQALAVTNKCYLCRCDFFFFFLLYCVLSATASICFHILISGNWKYQAFFSPVLFYRNKCGNDDFRESP